MNEEKKDRRILVSLNRCIAAVLSALFFVQTLQGLPLPALAGPPDLPLTQSLNLTPSDIKIPAALGSIKEAYDGKSQKIIFLIQDAHAIPDAQRSIHKLIEHFEGEYGVPLVALEGASLPLDPLFFKTFPDQALLRSVLEEYFDRGELSGGSAAAIFSAEKQRSPVAGRNSAPVIYHGIENWPLYEAGLKSFLEAMANSKNIVPKLDELLKAMADEKKKTYSENLLHIDQSLEAFHKNESELMAVLKKLAAVQPPDKGSDLDGLLAEISRPTGEDSVLEAEVRSIASAIKQALEQRSSEETKQDLRAFQVHYQDFQTSHSSADVFAAFLKQLCMKWHIRVHVSAKLNALVGHQQRMRDIEGTRLFDEFEKYQQSVKETLFRNESERRLDQRSRQLQLLIRLEKLELSRKDWNEIGKLLTKMDYWTVTQDGVAGKGDVADLFSKLKPNLEFYRNSEKRDQVLQQQTLQLMRQSRTHSAILVAGGFHAEGLTRSLQAEGISYVLVMPEMKRVPEETNYRMHMRGEVSWGDYFEVQNGKVNLYNAFVRGTRDVLLKSSKEDRGKLLKAWRDGMIRELAAQNRISESHEYTRFIDETLDASAKGRDFAGQWRANVNKFIEGLRGLRDRGNLTEPNIAQLLQPSVISDLTGPAGLARSEIRVDLIPSLRQGSPLSLAEMGSHPETITGQAVLKTRSEVRSEEQADKWARKLKDTIEKNLPAVDQAREYRDLFDEITAELNTPQRHMLARNMIALNPDDYSGDHSDNSVFAKGGRSAEDLLSGLALFVIANLPEMKNIFTAQAGSEKSLLDDLVASYNHSQTAAHRQGKTARPLSLPLLLVKSISAYYEESAVPEYIDYSKRMADLPGNTGFWASALSLLFTGFHLEIYDSKTDPPDILSIEKPFEKIFATAESDSADVSPEFKRIAKLAVLGFLQGAHYTLFKTSEEYMEKKNKETTAEINRVEARGNLTDTIRADLDQKKRSVQAYQWVLDFRSKMAGRQEQILKWIAEVRGSPEAEIFKVKWGFFNNFDEKIFPYLYEWYPQDAGSKDFNPAVHQLLFSGEFWNTLLSKWSQKSFQEDVNARFGAPTPFDVKEKTSGELLDELKEEVVSFGRAPSGERRSEVRSETDYLRFLINIVATDTLIQMQNTQISPEEMIARMGKRVQSAILVLPKLSSSRYSNVAEILSNQGFKESLVKNPGLYQQAAAAYFAGGKFEELLRERLQTSEVNATVLQEWITPENASELLALSRSEVRMEGEKPAAQKKISKAPDAGAKKTPRIDLRKMPWGMKLGVEYGLYAFLSVFSVNFLPQLLAWNGVVFFLITVSELSEAWMEKTVLDKAINQKENRVLNSSLAAAKYAAISFLSLMITGDLVFTLVNFIFFLTIDLLKIFLNFDPIGEFHRLRKMQGTPLDSSGEKGGASSARSEVRSETPEQSQSWKNAFILDLAENRLNWPDSLMPWYHPADQSTDQFFEAIIAQWKEKLGREYSRDEILKEILLRAPVGYKLELWASELLHQQGKLSPIQLMAQLNQIADPDLKSTKRREFLSWSFLQQGLLENAVFTRAYVDQINHDLDGENYESLLGLWRGLQQQSDETERGRFLRETGLAEKIQLGFSSLLDLPLPAGEKNKVPENVFNSTLSKKEFALQELKSLFELTDETTARDAAEQKKLSGESGIASQLNTFLSDLDAAVELTMNAKAFIRANPNADFQTIITAVLTPDLAMRLKKSGIVDFKAQVARFLINRRNIQYLQTQAGLKPSQIFTQNDRDAIRANPSLHELLRNILNFDPVTTARNYSIGIAVLPDTLFVKMDKLSYGYTKTIRGKIPSNVEELTDEELERSGNWSGGFFLSHSNRKFENLDLAGIVIYERENSLQVTSVDVDSPTGMHEWHHQFYSQYANLQMEKYLRKSKARKEFSFDSIDKHLQDELMAAVYENKAGSWDAEGIKGWLKFYVNYYAKKEADEIRPGMTADTVETVQLVQQFMMLKAGEYQIRQGLSEKDAVRRANEYTTAVLLNVPLTQKQAWRFLIAKHWKLMADEVFKAWDSGAGNRFRQIEKMQALLRMAEESKKQERSVPRAKRIFSAAEIEKIEAQALPIFLEYARGLYPQLHEKFVSDEAFRPAIIEDGILLNLARIHLLRDNDKDGSQLSELVSQVANPDLAVPERKKGYEQLQAYLGTISREEDLVLLEREVSAARTLAVKVLGETEEKILEKPITPFRVGRILKEVGKALGQIASAESSGKQLETAKDGSRSEVRVQSNADALYPTPIKRNELLTSLEHGLDGNELGISSQDVEKSLDLLVSRAPASNAAFGFEGAGMDRLSIQKDLIGTDFLRIIQEQKENKKFVLYSVGLGRAPLEMMKLIRLFYEKLQQTGQPVWETRFIGVNATPDEITTARKIFDYLEDFLKRDGLLPEDLVGEIKKGLTDKTIILNDKNLTRLYGPESRGQWPQEYSILPVELAELVKILKEYQSRTGKLDFKFSFQQANALSPEGTRLVRANLEKEWGESLPASYISERHVSYAPSAASQTAKAKASVEALLLAYLMMRSNLAAWAQPGTRYLQEPHSGLGKTAEKTLVPVSVFPGNRNVPLNELLPDRLPPDSEPNGIANLGTGLQVVLDEGKVQSALFADFLKSILSSAPRETRRSEVRASISRRQFLAAAAMGTLGAAGFGLMQWFSKKEAAEPRSLTAEGSDLVSRGYAMLRDRMPELFRALQSQNIQIVESDERHDAHARGNVITVSRAFIAASHDVRDFAFMIAHEGIHILRERNPDGQFGRSHPDLLMEELQTREHLRETADRLYRNNPGYADDPSVSQTNELEIRQVLNALSHPALSRTPRDALMARMITDELLVNDIPIGITVEQIYDALKSVENRQREQSRSAPVFLNIRLLPSTQELRVEFYPQNSSTREFLDIPVPRLRSEVRSSAVSSWQDVLSPRLRGAYQPLNQGIEVPVFQIESAGRKEGIEKIKSSLQGLSGDAYAVLMTRENLADDKQRFQIAIDTVRQLNKNTSKLFNKEIGLWAFDFLLRWTVDPQKNKITIDMISIKNPKLEGQGFASETFKRLKELFQQSGFEGWTVSAVASEMDYEKEGFLVIPHLMKKEFNAAPRVSRSKEISNIYMGLVPARPEAPGTASPADFSDKFMEGSIFDLKNVESERAAAAAQKTLYVDLDSTIVAGTSHAIVISEQRLNQLKELHRQGVRLVLDTTAGRNRVKAFFAARPDEIPQLFSRAFTYENLVINRGSMDEVYGKYAPEERKGELKDALDRIYGTQDGLHAVRIKDISLFGGAVILDDSKPLHNEKTEPHPDLKNVRINTSPIGKFMHYQIQPFRDADTRLESEDQLVPVILSLLFPSRSEVRNQKDMSINLPFSAGTGRWVPFPLDQQILPSGGRLEINIDKAIGPDLDILNDETKENEGRRQEVFRKLESTLLTSPDEQERYKAFLTLINSRKNDLFAERRTELLRHALFDPYWKIRRFVGLVIGPGSVAKLDLNLFLTWLKEADQYRPPQGSAAAPNRDPRMPADQKYDPQIQRDFGKEALLWALAEHLYLREWDSTFTQIFSNTLESERSQLKSQPSIEADKLPVAGAMRGVLERLKAKSAMDPKLSFQFNSINRLLPYEENSQDPLTAWVYQSLARSEVRMTFALQGNYGLTDVRISPISKPGKDNLWNIESHEGSFVLKKPDFRKTAALINWEASVLAELGAANAAQIIKTVQGENFIELDHELYVLYEAVQGKEFDWGEVEGASLKEAARWLAGVHQTLKDFTPAGVNYTPAERPRVIGVLNYELGLSRLETLKQQIEARGPPANPAEQIFLNEYGFIQSQIQLLRTRFTPDILSRLPVSITHGDFHQANGRYVNNGRFIGFDFEQAAKEATLRELANPFELRFPQGRSSDGASLAFDKVTDFITEYHKIRPLTADEIDLLPDVFRLAFMEGILFFAESRDKADAFLRPLKEQVANLKQIDSLDWKSLQTALRATRSEVRAGPQQRIHDDLIRDAAYELASKIHSDSRHPRTVVVMPGSGYWAGQILKAMWNEFYGKEPIQFIEWNGEAADPKFNRLQKSGEFFILLDDVFVTGFAMTGKKDKLGARQKLEQIGLDPKKMISAVLISAPWAENEESARESGKGIMLTSPLLAFLKDRWMVGAADPSVKSGIPFWHLVRDMGKHGKGGITKGLESILGEQEVYRITNKAVAARLAALQAIDKEKYPEIERSNLQAIAEYERLYMYPASPQGAYFLKQAELGGLQAMEQYLEATLPGLFSLLISEKKKSLESRSEVRETGMNPGLEIREPAPSFDNGSGIVGAAAHGTGLLNEIKQKFERVVDRFGWDAVFAQLEKAKTAADRVAIELALAGLENAGIDSARAGFMADRIIPLHVNEERLAKESGQVDGLIVRHNGVLKILIPRHRLLELKPDFLGVLLHELIEVELLEQGLQIADAHRLAQQVQDAFGPQAQGAEAARELTALLRDPFGAAKWEGRFGDILKAVLDQEGIDSSKLEQMSQSQWDSLLSRFLRQLGSQGSRAPPDRFEKIIRALLTQEKIRQFYTLTGHFDFQDLLVSLQRLSTLAQNLLEFGVQEEVVPHFTLEQIIPAITLSNALAFEILKAAHLAGDAWDQLQPNPAALKILTEGSLQEKTEFFVKFRSAKPLSEALPDWKAVAVAFGLRNIFKMERDFIIGMIQQNEHVRRQTPAGGVAEFNKDFMERIDQQRFLSTGRHDIFNRMGELVVQNFFNALIQILGVDIGVEKINSQHEEKIEVQKFLARGFDGIVFEGKFRAAGASESEKVVIKINLPQGDTAETFTERLIQVKRFTAGKPYFAKHFGIYSAVLDSGEQSVIEINEFVPGATFRTVLERMDFFGVGLKQNLNLLMQLFLAHAVLGNFQAGPMAGFVNRDVANLHNFIVGPRGLLRFIDFGNAYPASQFIPSGTPVSGRNKAAQELLTENKKDLILTASQILSGQKFNRSQNDTFIQADEDKRALADLILKRFESSAQAAGLSSAQLRDLAGRLLELFSRAYSDDGMSLPLLIVNLNELLKQFKVQAIEEGEILSNAVIGAAHQELPPAKEEAKIRSEVREPAVSLESFAQTDEEALDRLHMGLRVYLKRHPEVTGITASVLNGIADSLSRYRDNLVRVWVAYDEAKNPVGFHVVTKQSYAYLPPQIQARLHSDEEALFSTYAVLPDQQRTGIGRKLVQQGFQEMQAEGHAFILAKIDSRNIPSKNLMETVAASLGFMVTKLDTPLDYLIELSPPVNRSEVREFPEPIPADAGDYSILDRHHEQIENFKTNVLPRLFDLHQADRKLDIAVLGASKGEEVATILAAMIQVLELQKERWGEVEDWKIQIHGFEKFIELAEEANKRLSGAEPLRSNGGFIASSRRTEYASQIAPLMAALNRHAAWIQTKHVMEVSPEDVTSEVFLKSLSRYSVVFANAVWDIIRNLDKVSEQFQLNTQDAVVIGTQPMDNPIQRMKQSPGHQILFDSLDGQQPRSAELPYLIAVPKGFYAGTESEAVQLNAKSEVRFVAVGAVDTQTDASRREAREELLQVLKNPARISALTPDEIAVGQYSFQLTRDQTTGDFVIKVADFGSFANAQTATSDFKEIGIIPIEDTAGVALARKLNQFLVLGQEIVRADPARSWTPAKVAAALQQAVKEALEASPAPSEVPSFTQQRAKEGLAPRAPPARLSQRVSVQEALNYRNRMSKINAGGLAAQKQISKMTPRQKTRLITQMALDLKRVPTDEEMRPFENSTIGVKKISEFLGLGEILKSQNIPDHYAGYIEIDDKARSYMYQRKAFQTERSQGFMNDPGIHGPLTLEGGETNYFREVGSYLYMAGGWDLALHESVHHRAGGKTNEPFVDRVSFEDMNLLEEMAAYRLMNARANGTIGQSYTLGQKAEIAGYTESPQKRSEVRLAIAAVERLDSLFRGRPLITTHILQRARSLQEMISLGQAAEQDLLDEFLPGFTPEELARAREAGFNPRQIAVLDLDQEARHRDYIRHDLAKPTPQKIQLWADDWALPRVRYLMEMGGPSEQALLKQWLNTDSKDDILKAAVEKALIVLGVSPDSITEKKLSAAPARSEVRVDEIRPGGTPSPLPSQAKKVQPVTPAAAVHNETPQFPDQMRQIVTISLMVQYHDKLQGILKNLQTEEQLVIGPAQGYWDTDQVRSLNVEVPKIPGLPEAYAKAAFSYDVIFIASENAPADLRAVLQKLRNPDSLGVLFGKDAAVLETLKTRYAAGTNLMFGAPKESEGVFYLAIRPVKTPPAESGAKSEVRLQMKTSEEAARAGEFVVGLLKPGSSKSVQQAELQQIYKMSIADLEGFARAIQTVLDKKLSDVQPPQGSEVLAGSLDLVRKLLATLGKDKGAGALKLTFAVHLSEPGDHAGFFKELLKAALESGNKAEILLDAGSYPVLSREMGHETHQVVSLRKLKTKDLQGGIQVTANDEQSAIPIAVDDAEAAGLLHEIYQGLFFNSRGMNSDSDTLYASQALFAGFLLKLAEISSSKREDIDRSLQGITDPKARSEIRANYLKGELIRALTEVGYVVPSQAFQNSNGVIEIAGGSLIGSIISAFQARSEVRKAA